MIWEKRLYWLKDKKWDDSVGQVLDFCLFSAVFDVIKSVVFCECKNTNTKKRRKKRKLLSPQKDTI